MSNIAASTSDTKKIPLERIFRSKFQLGLSIFTSVTQNDIRFLIQGETKLFFNETDIKFEMLH